MRLRFYKRWFDSLKFKVFLPLVLMVGLIVAYVLLIWVPKSIENAQQESRILLQHTLEIVGDQITADLVNGQLDVVSLKLQMILLKNPSWKQIILRNAEGQILFPTAEGRETIKPSQNNVFIRNEMQVFGEKIGSLELVYDISESNRLIYYNAQIALIYIVIALLIFALAIALILHKIVIVPADRLAQASEKIATTDDIDSLADIKLPRITHDEIGRLTYSFSRMKDTIQKKHQDLIERNKQLTLAKEAADAANKAKSDFLANMSHELRTPMNGILGLAELVIHGELNREQKESMEAILASGSSLLDLLNDILDFSKIEAGELIIERRPFNLQDTMMEALGVLAPVARKKDITIRYNYDAQAPVSVVGDSTRIRQIVLNLVGNAIKFSTDSDIDLDISAVPGLGEREYIFTIRVTDRGIGIPPDKQDQIFNKFSQADTSTTRKFGGTGLGLAICRELATLMGGLIWFDSEPGIETTFTVELPLKLAETEIASMDRQRRSVWSRELKADFSGYHVLVVDDNPINMLYARKLLSNLGFEHIDSAENGVEALELYKKKSDEYDLILMDCQMPEMDGLEATRQIRDFEQKSANGKRVPVIALTANVMADDRDKCIEIGMDEYLSKPIETERLYQLLCQLLSLDAGGADGEAENMGQAGQDKSGTDSPRPDLPAKQPDDVGDGKADSSHEIEVGIGLANHTNKKTQESRGADSSGYLNQDTLDLCSGGDPEMEKMVLDLFMTTTSEAIATLQKNLDATATDEDWKAAAHKAKGGAAQIGAEKLSALFLAAEKGYKLEISKKQDLLRDIELAYVELTDYLESRTRARA